MGKLGSFEGVTIEETRKKGFFSIAWRTVTKSELI